MGSEIGVDLLKERKGPIAVSLQAGLGVGVYFAITVVVLWSIYSMRADVDGGYYTLTQARSLVIKMALVTTGLAFAAAVAGWMFIRPTTRVKAAVAGCFATGFFLAVYTVLNVLWRSAWQPGSTTSQFLPPWSDLNSHFFSEFNFLTYLLFVTPVEALLSACLLLWFWQGVIPVCDSRLATTDS